MGRRLETTVGHKGSQSQAGSLRHQHDLRWWPRLQVPSKPSMATRDIDIHKDPCCGSAVDPDTALGSSLGPDVAMSLGSSAIHPCQPVPHCLHILCSASLHNIRPTLLLFLSHFSTIYLLIEMAPKGTRWALGAFQPAQLKDAYVIQLLCGLSSYNNKSSKGRETFLFLFLLVV